MTGVTKYLLKLDEISDILVSVRWLNEELYMAAQGIGEDFQRNAIREVSSTAEDKIKSATDQLREVLDELREMKEQSAKGGTKS